jgi:tol-pal system protein YbgF
VRVILLSLAILLSACATRGGVRELSDRIDQMQKDVVELRRLQDATGRDSAAAVVEVHGVAGRLREMETRLRDTMDRVAALGNRVAAAEASVRELVTAVEALPRVPPPAPQSAVPDSPTSAETLSAERAFATALKTFRAGEHGQAVLELTDFVGRYPKHPLAARAQLWIGEAYFKQRDYRQALLEYRKAVEAAPDSVAAADAWLKIGQAYAALRERPAAAEAWQRVLRDYPASEAAGQARTFLRK